MAGHSKWANIKHRKEKADAKKGKMFSRIMKELINAVKQGGRDPKTNLRLKVVLQKAKEANIPNENIERNIKKAESADSLNYDEVLYELYGHGGVGILLEALTDNKNRTISDIRVAIQKRGGTIASPGSVSYQFDKKGVLEIESNKISFDDLFLLASDLGADDIIDEESIYFILTKPENLMSLKEEIEKKDIKVKEASIQMIPKLFIECEKEMEEKNILLIEWLENIDDVDIVYHNMKVE